MKKPHVRLAVRSVPPDFPLIGPEAPVLATLGRPHFGSVEPSALPQGKNICASQLLPSPGVRGLDDNR